MKTNTNYEETQTIKFDYAMFAAYANTKSRDRSLKIQVPGEPEPLSLRSVVSKIAKEINKRIEEEKEQERTTSDPAYSKKDQRKAQSLAESENPEKKPKKGTVTLADWIVSADAIIRNDESVRNENGTPVSCITGYSEKDIASLKNKGTITKESAQKIVDNYIDSMNRMSLYSRYRSSKTPEKDMTEEDLNEVLMHKEEIEEMFANVNEYITMLAQNVERNRQKDTPRKNVSEIPERRKTDFGGR